MRGSRRIGRHWVAVMLAVIYACLAPTSALGAYVPKPSFGSSGSGDGQMELVSADLLITGAPGSGLATNDTTHNVYVADTDNNRVVVSSSTGTFIGAFGADVGGAGVDVCSVGCLPGTPGTSPGAFEEVIFVAIDNSAGPSSGDVYVVDVFTNEITKFEADGTLVTSWGTGGQLDGSEATGGPFEELVGVNVNPSGSLFALEAGNPGHMFQFAEDGSFTTEFETPRGSGRGGLGRDPSGNFFKVNANPTVEKFEADGTDIGQVSTSNATAGIAADPVSGDLFVVRSTGEIDRYAFEPSGEVVGTGCTPAPFTGCPPTETISEGALSAGAGLAVDGAIHTVYAADPATDEIFPFALVTTPEPVTEAATAVEATTATLNGSVNPNGEPLTECFFEWGETTAYGETAPCEDPDFEEVGEGSSPVAVHADISGLKPGTTYHFQLAAANANNAPGETVPGGDETFRALGPTIKGESVSQVTANGARISGEINPNGKATSFAVQYVTEAQFQATGFAGASEAPIPPRSIGSGTGFEAVVQQLSGLAAQTAYRFRLTATNADATSFGTGGKFTTFALPATNLPDERKYEMVSPPEKTGEVIPPEPNSDLGGSCTFCLPAINKPTLPMQVAPDGELVLYEGQPFSSGLAAGPNEYVSERGSSEWSIGSLSSPLTTGRYETFSSDLSLGVLAQIDPPLSPEAPTRGDKVFANLYLRTGDEVFELLVPEEPPNRDPGLASFGDNRFRIRYAGGNTGTTFVPELSHLIFEANDALTEAVPGIAPAAPEAEAGDECTLSAKCNLYEWIEGKLHLVNVLPSNTSTSTSAVLGSGRLLVAGNPSAEAPDVDHAISDDGSRIFWSDEESGQVFVRVEVEETLEVPGPGSCKESVALKDRACFLTASADGSAVLLSDGELFEFDEGAEAYEPSADLTEGEGGFEGILGAGEDLSHIYFIDTADLTEGEENANKEEAEDGELNLYAWEEGAVSFIGQLVAGDNGFGIDGRFGAWKAAKSNRTAQVSSDGRFLAFMTQARLSEYDNTLSGGGPCRSGGSGSPACFEVFLYAADAGTLSCASCNPSGQRPLGYSNLSLLRPQVAFRQPNNLSSEGEGRLFFESLDALLPQDTNGRVQDVYQWEPNGVGTCEEAGGCVSLISSGTDANDSKFLDSSASGNDVFFITRQKLLGRDKDEQLDLYDARVGGGFEEEAEETCEPDACKGPISPPPVQRGALPPFAGPGNPPAKLVCQKGFVKKHGKCVKKPKKKKKSKGRASHNRGAHR